MSFIGRAEVWGHTSGPGNAMDSNRSSRLTSLDLMTGARLAASRNGAVHWVGGSTWDDVAYAQRLGPTRADRKGPAEQQRLTEQLRRPYRHVVEVISRRTNLATESRVCPRCGQAPHNEWGHEYERLVCQEITIA